jgi:hypothetical protein
MSVVKEQMAELAGLLVELKLINSKSKELRNRKKELETNILGYLESTDSPGLKFKELVVLKKETTTHTRKKKKEREDSVIEILENAGVGNPKKLYTDILAAAIGEEKTSSKLSVKTTIPEIF